MTTAHSSRTTRPRSSSCTTTSTTPPTWPGPTPRSTSWPRPATKDDFDAIVGLEKSLAFNVSGHVLHSIFWKNLSPDGGDKPDGDLAAAIDEHFGGFDAFKAHLTQASVTIQGSGWGALAWEPLGQRLIVEQVYDHQGNIGNGAVPLLVFDAWEHAFYLQYKNVKADFFAALWNIVNWPDVAARFDSGQGSVHHLGPGRYGGGVQEIPDRWRDLGQVHPGAARPVAAVAAPPVGPGRASPTRT